MLSIQSKWLVLLVRILRNIKIVWLGYKVSDLGLESVLGLECIVGNSPSIFGFRLVFRVRVKS